MSLAITPETKIGELLKEYPHLEETLVECAPAFSKLRNPVLRRTVARVTSLRQAAKVGGISLEMLINTLRSAAGFDMISVNDNDGSDDTGERFDLTNISITYDARSDIDNGVQPVGKVLNELKYLKSGEVYELITPFVPAPLIDMAKEKGFRTMHREVESGIVKTYFTIGK